MDLLSNVMLTLKVTDSAIVSFDLLPPWGFSVAAQGLQKPGQGVGRALIFSPLDAPCWVGAGGRAALRVEPGDSALVFTSEPSVCLSEPKAPVHDLLAVWPGQGLRPSDAGFGHNGPVQFRWRPLSASSDQEQRILGVSITVQEPERSPLLGILPNPLVVPRSAGRMFPWLGTIKEFLLVEQPMTGPGYAVTARHLATLIFTSLVRAHVAAEGADSATWLRGLSDPKIGHALGLMHERPGQPWTLLSLARACGMSRTSFARRFAALVGTTPMAHLAAVRMTEAAQQLIDGTPVGHVAANVGFRSDWAFRRAFALRYGTTPLNYIKRQRSA